MAQAAGAVFAIVIYKKLGLRNTIVLCRSICGVLYLAMGLSKNVETILVLRMFIMSMDTIGYVILSLILAVEIVGPNYTK